MRWTETGVAMTAGLPKVAVVIPCFCAKNMVGTVVKEVLQAAEQLADHCQLTVLVANDACRQEWGGLVFLERSHRYL